MDSLANLNTDWRLFRLPGNLLLYVQDFQTQAVGAEVQSNRKLMKYFYLLDDFLISADSTKNFIKQSLLLPNREYEEFQQ